MITLDQLRKAFPFSSDVTIYARCIPITAGRFGIVTEAQLAHFLAQAAAETGEFQHLEENLNYSTVRLMAVWPKRFPAAEVAQLYAKDPERLANLIYQGRNGNNQFGDGWRFRGRGAFMTTGRDNYAAAGKALNLPLLDQPGLLTDPQNALDSAASFWQEHKLNILADAGDLVGVTRAINGGINGLGQRAMYLSRLQEILK